MMEPAFISWLQQQLPAHPQLRLGIGDDAAILDLASAARNRQRDGGPISSGQIGTHQSGCLITVDLLTDGVDFLLSEADPRRIGRKALAVNLSDIAAMAGQPVAAVIGLALPKINAGNLARELYLGLLPLAEQFQIAIAGGDTNTWDGPLAISVTLIGQCTPRGALTRSAARPGDAILVTGRLGGSILAHHFDFTPRVDEALWLHERYELHAGMDISDGLTLDLSRLLTASGCGGVLDLDQIPISAAAHELAASLADGVTPLDHALSDGEDFELILAVPPEEAKRLLSDPQLPIPITQIGHCIAEPGLWQATPAGQQLALAPRGYQH